VVLDSLARPSFLIVLRFLTRAIVQAIPADGDQNGGLWTRRVVVGAIAHYIKHLAELINTTFWAD